MNKKQWYELFSYSKEEGTRTIGTFDTYLEALQEKIRLDELKTVQILNIDKWEDTDNPRQIM
jgi:hypothetical protein